MSNEQDELKYDVKWLWWLFMWCLFWNAISGCIDREEDRWQTAELKQLRQAVESYHSGKGVER
jgi:hypothetical protein